ncbi:hypothetical protein [Thermodesulfatator atlanticus]
MFEKAPAIKIAPELKERLNLLAQGRGESSFLSGKCKPRFLLETFACARHCPYYREKINSSKKTG